MCNKIINFKISISYWIILIYLTNNRFFLWNTYNSRTDNKYNYVVINDELEEAQKDFDKLFKVDKEYS